MPTTFLYTMYIMTKQDKQQELKLKLMAVEIDIQCLQSQIRSEKERLEEMKNDTSVGEDWSSSVCILRTQKDLKTAEKQLIRKQNKLNKMIKETI
jgi:predicted  nucleic acid-binding Zn-ribbon protein